MEAKRDSERAWGKHRPEEAGSVNGARKEGTGAVAWMLDQKNILNRGETTRLNVLERLHV